MKSLGSFLSLNLLLISCLFSQGSFASVSSSAKISDAHLEIGDQVTVSIEISSDKKLTRLGPKFRPPEISGLDYLGVSESSSTSLSFNGQNQTSSYKMTYSISYSCNKEGAFKIPSMNLDVPALSPTRPLSFRVYKKLPEGFKKKRSRLSGRRRNSMNSLLDRFMGRPNQSSQNQEQDLEFFTEVEVSKTEIFKGEQILATWYVYVSEAASLGTFDTLRFPTLKGFWKEDVNFAARFFWKPVQRDGKRYKRALLSSYALTPYKEGEYEIDPFELRTVASLGFFNHTRKVLKAKSDPVSILVKPHPLPKPESFLGGVGRFKFELNQSSKKQEVLNGEPFTIGFRIIGDESATKFLKRPALDLGNAFKLYKSKEDYKFVVSKISSYKLFNYSLIPKAEGVFKFPDVKVSFLDPDTGAYYDQFIKLPTYKVVPNKNFKKIKDEDFVLKGNVQSSDEKFKPQKLSNGFGFFEILYKPIATWLIVALLLAVICVGFYFYKKISSVPSFQENLAANLEERLKLVSQLLKEKKRNQALTELINVLSLLVGSVSGKRFGAEQEFEKAIENLPSSLKSSRSQLEKLNEDLQNMRFGSSLESYTNKVKLEECLQDFQKIFIDFRKYLR